MRSSLGKGRQSGGGLQGSPAPKGFAAFGSSSASSQLSYLAEPPDFQSISDPQAVVSFKNLLKKDGTTKAKALEDLIAYVDSKPFEEGGGVEDSVLEAWIQLYGRVSIDNSRRVRELSHLLQLALLKSARKRMEKRIPKSVGSWLAGSFDKDRVVSRAAGEGLSSFLTTPEKTLMFWKKCQPQILEYAMEAIQETQESLSDERSTSTDDAEAKYHRVVGGSLSLILGLLQILSDADVMSNLASYTEYFNEDKVWKATVATDTSVRKIACQLFWVCLEKRPGLILDQITKAKKIILVEGLKMNQNGSSAEYVKLLTRLTTLAPQIWVATDEKKKPISRMISFLEKGSQGGALTYWKAVERLLVTVPLSAIPISSAVAVLGSLRIGISHRESRLDLSAAWTAYLQIADHFIQQFSDENDRLTLVQEHLLPIIDGYLSPTPDSAVWNIGNQQPERLLSLAFATAVSTESKAVQEAVIAEFKRLADGFCTKISNSLPEVSKEYEKSQDAIADEGRKWFTLVGSLRKPDLTKNSAPEESTGTIITHSVGILRSRNLKPYGAAAILRDCAERAPTIYSGAMLTGIADFLEELSNDMALLRDSRSAPHLVCCIEALARTPSTESIHDKIWKSWISSILKLPEPGLSAKLISPLISYERAAQLTQRDNDLIQYITSLSLACAKGHGSPDSWRLYTAAVGSAALSDEQTIAVAEKFIDCLDEDGDSKHHALRAIDIIANRRPGLLSNHEKLHTALITHLLAMMEIKDTQLANQAASLKSLLESGSGADTPVVTIIQQNLEQAGPGSLDIDTIVFQALRAIKSDDVRLEDIFPNTITWMNEFTAAIGPTVDHALSVGSNMAGAFFLIKPGPSRTVKIARDRKGRSISARMALYTSRLLASGVDFSSLPQRLQVETLFLLQANAHAASDQILLMNENFLFFSLGLSSMLSEADALVEQGRRRINDTIDRTPNWHTASEGLIAEWIQVELDASRNLTPFGLYASRSLAGLLENLADVHGIQPKLEEIITGLDVFRTAPETVLGAAATLSGFGSALETSKLANNFCNRLISDLAGASPDSDKTLIRLILFNAFAEVYEVGELPVASNRLVFAVKQLTSWLEDAASLDASVATETCRALQRLFPCIKDVYGSWWEAAIAFCISTWRSADSSTLSSSLPLLLTTLKLMSMLETMEDRNDDLEDAIKEFAERKSAALIDLLNIPRDYVTQPLDIVDGILSRQVANIPVSDVKDASDLYTLVASSSRTIQTTAFKLLHRLIPVQREQYSVQVLLDKTDGRLPDELLSLLLDAPTLDQFSDEALNEFPTPVRSYLLSWHLVFDAYSTSAAKVRNDYTEQLKTDNYVAPLMNFMFDVLGHSAAHALNLDKEGFTIDDIRKYDISIADHEPEERHMHWLLIHVFYLVLRHVHPLFKQWYLDCSSRQTKIAVEAWVQRYFSPLVIAEALDDAAAWATAQEPPGEGEQELGVKVSHKAREVTASYEIDDAEVAIAIQLPANYPIDGVAVTGLRRVVVSERKWQSWLLATQGVITFSNGSIPDGLSAFRRNVVAAMSGQTECAICYSLVSSDSKLPDKRCETCKKLFHRTCLYKWFQSSNNNTCPLCRNPIGYLGADSQRRNRGQAE